MADLAPGNPAGTRMPEAGPRVSDVARLLELFVFYNGRVPGFELGAEGFDLRGLAAEGFIFRTRNPFDFGCFLIGPKLEKCAAFDPRSAEWHSAVSQIDNLRTLENPERSSTTQPCRMPFGDTADYQSALPESPHSVPGHCSNPPGTGVPLQISTVNRNLTLTQQTNMKTNRKTEPCIVQSRQALEAVVADVVKLKLEHARLTAGMEQEIAKVQKRHQEELLALSRQLEAREAGVFVYCQKNRAALFSERKSVDLLLATVGFELTPPRVDKLNGKDTFGKVAARLANSTWGEPYLRYPDPELNKERILADRATLTPEQLHEAGLKIEQDENFFIRPKSEIAEQSVKEAA